MTRRIPINCADNNFDFYAWIKGREQRPLIICEDEELYNFDERVLGPHVGGIQ